MTLTLLQGMMPLYKPVVPSFWNILSSYFQVFKWQLSLSISKVLGFLGGARGKEPACECRRWKRHEFDP